MPRQIVFGNGGDVRNGRVQQPLFVFKPQHAHDGFLQERFQDHATLDQLRQIADIMVARHLNVDRGLQSISGYILRAIDRAVFFALAERVPVGDQHAVKAPRIAQKLPAQPPIERDGDTADRVEGGHDQITACTDRRLVCGQIRRQQRALGNLCIVIVAPCLHGAVGGEMFDAGGEPGRAVRALLISSHRGGGHAAREQNVLAIGLGAAAPPGVA